MNSKVKKLVATNSTLSVLVCAAFYVHSLCDSHNAVPLNRRPANIQ